MRHDADTELPRLTVRLSRQQMRGLRLMRREFGVTFTEQMRRAIDLWLATPRARLLIEREGGQQ